MSHIRPPIVIVGAGAAGIAAATRLIANGFSNVKILEAEDRIGGRLHSVTFEGNIVDLGAQWIHGEEGNKVYDVVKGLDITGHNKTSDYHSFNFYTSNNSKLNKNLINRLSEISDEILDDKMCAATYGGSLGSYFREKYYDKIGFEFGSENQEILNVAKMIEEWTSKFTLCLDPAGSWHHVSASSLDAYKRCDGDPYINWKNNGYSSFLDALITNVLSLSKEEFLEKHVLLSKEVNKITWDRPNSKDKKVTINCSDGSSYHADHIILTVSVGVLRHIHTAFDPSLPTYKVNCLEHIPLGTCHKIFLKFSKKWWPDDVKDFSFLWTDEDKKNLAKEFPDGPIHNGRSWLEDLFGFFTIDVDPNILLGWVVGSMTNEVECLSDDIVQNGAMFILRKFVGKFYDVTEATSILRSKWATNPHFYGTYSYVGLDMKERGVTPEDLAKPLLVDGRPVVLFGGEATHSLYFSTVHGAVETGYREADTLIDLYKI